jgi:hypothetical protein
MSEMTYDERLGKARTAMANRKSETHLEVIWDLLDLAQAANDRLKLLENSVKVQTGRIKAEEGGGRVQDSGFTASEGTVSGQKGPKTGEKA